MALIAAHLNAGLFLVVTVYLVLCIVGSRSRPVPLRRPLGVKQSNQARPVRSILSRAPPACLIFYHTRDTTRQRLESGSDNLKEQVNVPLL